MKFKMNNHEWKIEERPEEELLEEYHQRQPNAYACLGLTFYKEHKIWIAEELCGDEKIRTLKHELTHCYIWENGFYNVDFNNEELLCDFMASAVDIIHEIVEEYFKELERVDVESKYSCKSNAEILKSIQEQQKFDKDEGWKEMKI